MSRKILHISTSDYGGAGSAVVRIHNSFIKHGYDSIAYFKNLKNNNYNTFTSNKKDKSNLFFRLCSILFRKLLFKDKYCMYELSFKKSNCCVIKFVEQFGNDIDYVFVHWISNFLDLSDIHNIKRITNAKIFFYLMDMNNFTGGCHYSYGCTGYQNQCNSCPADRFSFKNGLPFKYYKRKKFFYELINPVFISPNIYVQNQFKLSSIRDYSNFVSYIPIDKNVFKMVRTKQKDYTILFGSSKLSDNRKGFTTFLELLNKLSLLNIENHNFNIIVPGLDIHNYNYPNMNFIDSKRANNDEELSKLYQMSSVFVCCSFEDSGPMMVSESLMCGTPVISFKVGIVDEMIVNGYNGFKVDIGDIDAMAIKLLYHRNLSPKSFFNLSKNARESALSKLSQSCFVHNFEKYQNI